MTEVKFEPMLARSATLSHEEIAALTLPMFASPKLDGMRIVKVGGRVLTRNLKPLANHHVRGILEEVLPDGIDGELCLPNLTEPLADVMSAFRSRDGEPAFRFMAFDFFEGCASMTFLSRQRRLATAMASLMADDSFGVEFLAQTLVREPADLQREIESHLALGFEGTMLRAPNGPYKMGRSTLKEGYLLKVKPFHDEEATITGLHEEMENTNETKTATGARSTAQAGKVAKGRLGAFAAVFDDGTEFTVSGFTDADKEALWARKEHTIGRRITVRYQVVHGGRKPGESPRHPQFKGFREE